MDLLGPGGSIVYSTHPIGQTTSLNASLPPESSGAAASVAWHIVLCCQDWHTIRVPHKVKVDISEAAGAMVTVSNNGLEDINVWIGRQLLPLLDNVKRPCPIYPGVASIP